MIKYFICMLSVLLPTFLFAKENRCGWLENPTPANYWLTDKDGEWTISTQGKQGPEGMEYLVGFPSDEFIRTNYNYGYGCGCIVSDVIADTKKITKIYSFKHLSLRTCKNDPLLKEKTEDIRQMMKNN